MAREKDRRLARVELPILRSWLCWSTFICAAMAAALYRGNVSAIACLVMATLAVASAGGFTVLALIAPWRTTAADVDDDRVELPHWAWTLREEQREELEELLGGLERNIRMARESAVEAQGSASESQAGLWAVIDEAAAAEEAVRGRLVGELHDGVAQLLVVAAYMTEDEDVTPSDLRSHLVATEVELRDVMTFALPPQLRDGSLGQSVRYLSDTLALRRNLTVKWDWPAEGDGRLNEAVALTLYRFFQEALSNTAKHAGVDTARASLWFEEGDRIVAVVEDDGAGFEVAQVEVGEGGHHIGMAMMRDRARQVRARLTVHSEVGRGTVTRLEIPGPPAGVPRPIPVGTLD